MGNPKQVDEHPLSPPSLEELADLLKPALEANYKESSVSVTTCPDLREAPFHLAAPGLTGRECIADIGGQPNLFPEPRLETRYSMVSCARQMGMSQERGMIIGAGAGPWLNLNTNSELAPNFSWEGAFDDVKNNTYFTKVDKETGAPVCQRSPSTDCALMMNLYVKGRTLPFFDPSMELPPALTWRFAHDSLHKLETFADSTLFCLQIWLSRTTWTGAQDHCQGA